MNIQIEEFSLDSDDGKLFSVTTNGEPYTISYYKTHDSNIWKPMIGLEYMFDFDMRCIVNKAVQDYIKLKNLFGVRGRYGNIKNLGT